MSSFFLSLRRKIMGEGQPRPAKIQKPSLSNFVKTVCVPKWFEVFSDDRYGGFHERLDENFQPLDTGYKRLLTQCRQIYIYVHADQGSGKFLPRLKDKYDFITRNYYDPLTQGWAFSVAPDGSPLDGHLDLYAQSFLILSFSQYAKASGSEQAADFSRQTAHLIDRAFRVEEGHGFYEALNADLSPVLRMRRQNPHMHLFEACLFAYDAQRDEIFARLSHELYGLFKSYFFDEKTGTLGEFFTDGLQPHETDGHRVEAGHHFEWVWLLDYYRKLFPDYHDEAFSYMTRLYDWACRHGYDPDFGGIYDEQDRSGEILKSSKRVWPLCEAIKAHRAMRSYVQSRSLPLLESTKDVLKKRYIRKDAGWTESWNRDFTRKTVDYLPGTSVYHL